MYIYIYIYTGPPVNHPPCLNAQVPILIKIICLHISGGPPANDNSASGFKLVVYYQIYMCTNILAATYIRSIEELHRLQI